MNHLRPLVLSVFVLLIQVPLAAQQNLPANNDLSAGPAETQHVVLREFATTAQYNAACGQALLSQTGKAFESLRGAIQTGFDDLELMVGDDDLKSLRDKPEFLRLVRQLAQIPTVKARILQRSATQFIKKRQYQQAITKLTESHALLKNAYPQETHPDGHPAIAKVLNELGVVQKWINQFDQSQEYLEQAWEMRKRIFPPQRFPDGHVDLATSLNDIASLNRARGDYPRAVDFFQRSLEMKVRLFPLVRYPSGHVNVATAMANLATTLVDAGRPAEAHDYFLQQLAMTRKIYAPAKYPDGHARLVQAISSVGHSFRNQGRTAEAATYARQSLHMAQRLFPAAKTPGGHPLLAECINDLGLVLHRQGKFVKAEEQFRAAYSMFRALYPGEKGHPRVFYGLINLGDVARDQGAYVDAERWYREAVDMQRGFYPPLRFPKGHPAMVQTFSKLAGVLDSQNRGVEALPLHESALDILHHFYPPNKYPNGHPDLARGQSNLAVALRARGKHMEAQRLHETALDSRRKLYPSEKFPNGHPDIASSLNNIATLLLDNGDPVAALGHYQQHLTMIEGFYPRTKFPFGHPDLANALTNIGQTHGELGDLAAAVVFVERSLKMWQTLYPNGHPDIPRTQDVLGALNELQGQLANARQLYTDAYRTREQLFPPHDYPNGHVALTDSLARLTDLMMELNDFPKSKEYADRMLSMTRRLYPTDDYPQGHTELAIVLSKASDAYKEMGQLSGAEELLLESLKIRRSLYSNEQYPQGHIMIARCLNSLALLYDSQGRHERARGFYEASLTMRRRRFPAHRFPRGHVDLARGLNNQGTFMESLGEFDAARRFHEEALAMRQRLYPAEKYPRGHRDLSLSHHNLAIALQGQGKLDRAEFHLRKQLEMLPKLFTQAEYPNGHPRMAGGLNSLGSLLREKDEWTQAGELFDQALTIRRKLYSDNGKTFDHARVAESLNNVANACSDLGDYKRAIRLQQESVEMNRRLYARSDYPLGHPSLAAGLANLGSLQIEMGQPELGIPLQIEATDMQYRLARAHVVGASEAESLNFVSRHMAMPHGLLSAWEHAKLPDADLYRRVWLRKGMVHRVMAARNGALRAAAAADEDELYERYLAARRGLSRLVLSPGSSDSKQRQDRLESMRVLGEEKESIERELTRRIPEFVEQFAVQETSPDELANRLPFGTVFVDFIIYLDTQHDPKQPGVDGTQLRWKITAFVVANGQRIVRVPLGDLAPVSKRITSWRQSIAETSGGGEPDELGRRLWNPIEKHFPNGTHTVVLCPDGALTALPWAALPGREPGTVLLEDYAIAIVPYGPFLLDRSNVVRPVKSNGDDDLFLAVGDVAYDSRPAPPGTANLMALRDATVSGGTISWPALPAARDEVNDILATAGDRRTVSLLGDQASTARTIEMLPLASGVHFATHGFFADASFRSALQLDQRLFGHAANGGERSSVAGRNPLTLAGLVLAGANLPPKMNEFGLLRDEGGVLTGEVIAALPLGKMRLAVLSACDTGVGEVAGGEGVFGLQRAFHIAGAQNVVASLWKVDDHATAALMRLFYHKLWTQNKTPLQALRESQLAIYRHPEQIKQLSTSRGLNFDKVVKLMDTQHTVEKPETSPTKQWAAFVLSGFGG